MAWTAPVTWTAGQIVGASDLNAQVRDNQTYLLSGRATAYLNTSTGSDYTAGAIASLTAVDATNIKMVLSSVSSGRIAGFWLFGIEIDDTAHGPTIILGTLLDGVTASAIQPGITMNNTNFNGTLKGIMITLPFFFSGVSAGSHTLTLGWRNTSTAGVAMRLYGAGASGQVGLAWEA
jgi:hypothetical protein